MRRLGIAAAAALLLSLPAPASAEPGATCDGKPATIVGTPGPDDLEGTPGDDVVALNGAASGTDHYEDDGGDDVVCVGTGHAEVRTGRGADKVLVDGVLTDEDYSRSTVRLGEGADHLEGNGDITAYGGRGDDVLVTQGGYDDLAGGMGDDRVETGDGPDTIRGGPGQDTADGGGEGASLEFADGDGDSVTTPMTGGLVFDVPAGTVTGRDGTTTFSAITSFTGTPYADVFRGSEGADFFDGVSGQGRDVAVTGDGDDVVHLLLGRVDSGPGDDYVEVTVGSVEARAGDDVVWLGETLPDSVRVPERRQDNAADLGTGHDLVIVSAGDESVVGGGPGRDRVSFGDVPRGRARGGAGVDALHADDQPSLLDVAERRWRSKDDRAQRTWRYSLTFRGFDLFRGSYSRDVMYGSAGPDRMSGGDGSADVLVGRGGDDHLDGGGEGSSNDGDDVADGGPGRDTCLSFHRQRRCEVTSDEG